MSNCDLLVNEKKKIINCVRSCTSDFSSLIDEKSISQRISMYIVTLYNAQTLKNKNLYSPSLRSCLISFVR